MSKKEAMRNFSLSSKNKKAQGLSTSAIVLIVLGVIVLVILAVGFITGWDTFGDILGGGNNVDKLADQCSLACASGADYGYCSQVRELKIENNVAVSNPDFVFEDGGEYTCDQLERLPNFGSQCDIDCS